MDTIKYISDLDFKKLTKKQKLSLESTHWFDEIEIQRLVLIPTNKKSDGWCLGHFFAYTEDKGWWKPTVYDCWSIRTEYENPATPKYMILKGDFQNGGVNIFTFVDEHHTAYISYGGEITIKKKQ
jgi:hypothetical protein